MSLLAGLYGHWLWPTFGGYGTWLAEQDAVAKKSEPGVDVHLPFEELDLGVDAFGTAVVERQAERGVYCGAVIGQAAGEGVHVRQIDLSGEFYPVGQQSIVAVFRVQEGGEVPDEAAQHGHLIAGGDGGIEPFSLGVGQGAGFAEEQAGQPLRRDRELVALDPALVDVPVQRVLAAGVAKFLISASNC